MNKKTALVLTGGGARGAYQAGILRGIAEIVPKDKFPFPIITGVSAGSINAAFLACCSGSFEQSAKNLWRIWENLEPQNIFSQSKVSLLAISFKFFINALFGIRAVSPWPISILDNTPLEKLLAQKIDAEAIKKRINRGDLSGVCFSATNFNTGLTTSFFEAHSSVAAWAEPDRLGVETVLGIEHVMASCALPGIFKLVEINGSYYGDGSTRVNFPLDPAIKLGAERILAVDMRFKDDASPNELEKNRRPTLGDIIASLLDTLFSDALDQDLNRLKLINEFIKSNAKLDIKYKEIPSLLLRPSKNPSVLAEGIYENLSKPLRMSLGFLGAYKGKNLDLISHMAFEKVYTERLLKLGYKDAINQKDRLLDFLS